MPIEHVTRGLQFENLYVEVSVERWICDNCGRRQAFHDNPQPPYGDAPPPNPERLGWKLKFPLDDGSEEGCTCPKCYAEQMARLEQSLKHKETI
jgi:hypothetical protein